MPTTGLASQYGACFAIPDAAAAIQLAHLLMSVPTPAGNTTKRDVQPEMIVARNASPTHEFDSTWILLRVLERAGVAKSIKLPHVNLALMSERKLAS